MALALAAGGAVYATTASASIAPTRIKAAMSGVGYADREEWGRWRGRPVQTSATWNDAKDSTGAMTWGNMNALYTVHSYYSDGRWGGTLSLAQPMYASNENVGSCASVAEIRSWVAALRGAWTGNTYIRLGWEFNGDWYTWKQQPGDGAAFKRCWVRWYDTVKGADPTLKLVWNPNFQSSSGSLNVNDFWPGAEYVDAAGPDQYARNNNGKLADPNAKGNFGEPVGIYAWQAWVAAKGVPFAVSEWGINDYDSWGSADPEFITQMRTAFVWAAQSGSGLAYEDYFDGSTAFNCKFSLHDKDCGYDKHPTQAQRYQSLFSQPYPTSGGSTPTPTPTPTPTGTTPPATPGINLALNKQARSSSDQAADFTAAKAFDGDATTRWSSQFSDPQWISVDLGSVQRIGSVRLRWEAAAGKAYKIQTSTDNSAWADVASTANGKGGTEMTTFAATSARYVRLAGTQRTTQWGYSLYEVEVFAPADPSEADTNVALGKPVTANSFQAAGFEAGKAVDGNATTRWSSSFSDPAWIAVDLGAGTTVRSVKLKWEAASGKAYKIQTSDDQATWTDRASVAAGTGSTETVAFDAVTARYIRLYGTQRTTQWGYSLWEFEVYGVGGGGAGSPANQTIGTGDIDNPATGPGPSGNVGGSGFRLVKNWDFGADGTIKSIADMSKEFVYHDQFGTIANGTNYGSVTAAPSQATAINGQPVDAGVRQVTADSLVTTQKARNGETTVSPNDHNAINGSFMATWAPATAGSRLGRDILWETRVRYDTPRYFWFALWCAGTQWNKGAELDLTESFGYDNTPQGGGTNYDGRYWHADPVGGSGTTDYANWGNAMSSRGITSYDAKAYHTWSLLYRKDNSYVMYVDGRAVQSGSIEWTNGGGASGNPIDFHFLFDAGWGHTQVASVNHSMPASEFQGKYYEFDYSRVYLR